MPASPPQPVRKRGGQPGNLNAATHGFYSRQLKPSDLAGLDKTQVAGLEQEIELLRVFIRRFIELGGEPHSYTEANGQLHTLCLALQTLTSLTRTQQFILSRGGGEFNASVRNVVAELTSRWKANEATRQESPASDWSIFYLGP